MLDGSDHLKVFDFRIDTVKYEDIFLLQLSTM